jgi:hypothetical protein
MKKGVRIKSPILAPIRKPGFLSGVAPYLPRFFPGRSSPTVTTEGMAGQGEWMGGSRLVSLTTGMISLDTEAADFPET